MYFDYVFTAIFALEVIIKVRATLREHTLIVQIVLFYL